jgi:hypothetical protein
VDEPGEPRQLDRFLSLNGQKKLPIIHGVLAEHWIARIAQAGSEAALVRPIRHQELELVLQAHADEHPQESALEAVLRMVRIVGWSVR